MSVVVMFTVNGLPKTKGSMRYIGSGRMVEGNRGSKDWRTMVAESAFAEIGGVDGKVPDGFPVTNVPLHIDAIFRFPRPKSKKRGSPITRATGDIDKLLRNILDALQDAGIVGDDAQFTSCTASKQYVADQSIPGAKIIVTRVSEER